MKEVKKFNHKDLMQFTGQTRDALESIWDAHELAALKIGKKLESISVKYEGEYCRLVFRSPAMSSLRTPGECEQVMRWLNDENN